MPYIGVSPFNGVRKKHTYTATASQTTFSGVGAEGITLSYKDSTFVDVFQNGVKLGEADYTSTSGTSIVLGTGASLNDIVEVVVYDVFSVADTVSKADGGTFDGNVTIPIATASTSVKTPLIEFTDGDDALTIADGGNVTANANLTVTGNTTLNGKFLIDGSNNDLMTFRTTGDTSSQVLGLQFQNDSEAVTAQIFGTGDNSSSGVFRIKGIGDVAIIGGEIGVDGNAGDLVVKSAGDVHVGTGDLVFATAGKGIVLGATSNTAANTLDDYEEGTWTATLTGSSSNPSSTVQSTGQRYTKVGRFVFAQALFSNVNTSGASGAPRVTGLPFSAATSYATGNVMLHTGFNVGGGVVNVSPFVSTTQVQFYQSVSAGAWAEIAHNATSGVYLYFTVTYEV